MLCAGEERAARDGARSRRRGPFAAPTDRVPVLIVVDDANFCAAVCRALAATPFLPFSVRSGGEALRFLARAAALRDPLLVFGRSPAGPHGDPGR